MSFDESNILELAMMESLGDLGNSDGANNRANAGVESAVLSESADLMFVDSQSMKVWVVSSVFQCLHQARGHRVEATGGNKDVTGGIASRR